MPDREKVIEGLEKHNNNDCDYGGISVCPYWGESHCSMHLCSDALALLREQEAQVLIVEEVKRIGADNFGALSSEDLTILWIEEFGKNYGFAPVVAKWDEDDWNGEPNDIVRAYYFGSDLDERFNLNEYNRTWRLWTNKPTKTQRMGAAWYA